MLENNGMNAKGWINRFGLALSQLVTLGYRGGSGKELQRSPVMYMLHFSTGTWGVRFLCRGEW
jgi:hypothetical protein